jgi:hypothetical protein
VNFYLLGRPVIARSRAPIAAKADGAVTNLSSKSRIASRISRKVADVLRRSFCTNVKDPVVAPQSHDGQFGDAVTGKIAEARAARIRVGTIWINSKSFI